MSNVETPSLPIHPVGTGGFLDPESVADEFGVKNGMNVADFGCGAGYFTITLAERVGSEGKVYALDVQENALDNVKTKARANGISNIETIRTNLEIVGSSSLTDGSQDVILLANILFQSDKRGDIIREAKRVLKGGGRMIIIDWKKGIGQFGPPESIKTDKEELSSLAQKEDFLLEKTIDAGQFHFGLIFKKP